MTPKKMARSEAQYPQVYRIPIFCTPYYFCESVHKLHTEPSKKYEKSIRSGDRKVNRYQLPLLD